MRADDTGGVGILSMKCSEGWKKDEHIETKIRVGTGHSVGLLAFSKNIRDWTYSD